MNVWKHVVFLTLVSLALGGQRVAAQPEPWPDLRKKLPEQRKEEPGVKEVPPTQGSGSSDDEYPGMSTPFVRFKGIVNNRVVFEYRRYGSMSDYFQVRWGRGGMNEVQHKYNSGPGWREFVIPEDALPNTEYIFKVQTGYSGKHFGFIGREWTEWATATGGWFPGKKGPPEITSVVEKDGKLRFYYRAVGESKGHRITWFRKGYAAKLQSVPLFRQLGNLTLSNDTFEIPEKLKYGTEYTFRVQSVYANGTFSNWAEKKHVTAPDPRPVDVSTKNKGSVQAPLDEKMADKRTGGPVQAPLAKGMADNRKVGPVQAVEAVKPKAPAPKALPKPKATGAVPSPVATPNVAAPPPNRALVQPKDTSAVQSKQGSPIR